jgi:molecular chaperone GrpE (heat shock protein)
VMQEERAAGADEGPPVVADVMRAGYRVKGRVLRPAMVKVAR